MTAKVVGDISELKRIIGNRPVYMMLGYGDKSQFESVTDLKQVVAVIAKYVPEYSVILYFGDTPKESEPDIGYAYQLLAESRKDLQFIMIQISEAREWGTPSFVSHVYWHDDYNDKCKWSGVDEAGQPCSSTKVWVSLAPFIKCVFILGGGPITVSEYQLVRKLNIPFVFFGLPRKYIGDKTTLVTQKVKPTLEDKYGSMYFLL